MYVYAHLYVYVHVHVYVYVHMLVKKDWSDIVRFPPSRVLRKLQSLQSFTAPTLGAFYKHTKYSQN